MKSIEINDFRCFQHLSLPFTSGINLLIGDNASGKTSLLLACKYAVNCFFSGFSDQYTIWPKPHKNDFMHLNVGEKRLGTSPIKLGFTWQSEGLPALELASTPQYLVCKNEKNRAPLVSGLKELRDYGRFLLQKAFTYNSASQEMTQLFALPLIASYSTHGIHKSQKVQPGYFSEINQTPSFGYYLSSSTDGLLDHWIRRLLILEEAGRNELERSIVLKALNDMFGADGCNVISSFDIRINYKDVVCHFVDGREIPVSLLSDGYRRLVSIVVDLAFRCALLNSLKYGIEATRKTTGTVIIDEIDLHLHPSLQAIVLKALQNTFPNLQFIVSTHAPMVMSGVESDERNCVLYMAYEETEGTYTVEPVETYGMDLSSLAEIVLKVPSRNPSVKQKLDQLADFIDREQYDQARILLGELRKKFGDRLPELSGFDTQIEIEESLR